MLNAWQDIAAISVVAIAAIYLTRTFWPAGKPSRGSGCGPCGGCGSAADDSAADDLVAEVTRSQVVPIEQLRIKRR